MEAVDCFYLVKHVGCAVFLRLFSQIGQHIRLNLNILNLLLLLLQLLMAIQIEKQLECFTVSDKRNLLQFLNQLLYFILKHTFEVESDIFNLCL